MPTQTTTYGLEKPLVNNATDADQWGGYLNGDLDDLDGLIKTAIQWQPSAQSASFSITAPTVGSTATGSSKILYLCDATAGNIVVTLPTAASCSGMNVGFKKTDATTNTVTVNRASTDTIDGATSQVMSSQWDRLEIASDGTSAWRILSTPSANVFTGDSGSGGTTGLVPAPAAGDAAANKFLKASGSWQPLYFTRKFTSTDQTITSGGLLTLAHGLTVAPDLVNFELVCQTGEFGFSAGNVVPIDRNNAMAGPGAGTGVSLNMVGAAIVVNATNILIRFTNQANVFYLPNFSDGSAGTGLTNANWRLRVKAWA